MTSRTLVDVLKEEILHCDPYEGFDYATYENDLTGGEIYPVVEQLIDQIRPQFILEIGSWKGKSAVHMANLLLKYKIPNPTIVCVDTWLGSDPVHQWLYKNDPTWGMRNLYSRGYPTMYFQFLANICYEGMQDIIVPFPNTSGVAARWFEGMPHLKPDLIYIDAGHDEDDCYADISNFWPILRDGGIMFGDDFDAGWPGVICATSRFAKENKLQLMRSEVGNKWVLQKIA